LEYVVDDFLIYILDIHVSDEPQSPPNGEYHKQDGCTPTK